ncbi:MAG: hypothetical protein EBS42_04710 [Caulobacteraceae bacterium]|jgi:hypothetical protein|nr:hypothetical protein [Caulobacteraceae bacterium]
MFPVLSPLRRPGLLLLAAIALMTVGLQSPALAQAAWRTHVDREHGYRVEFPGVPSQTQETTPLGNVMDVASLEAGTTGAFLVIATVSAEPLDGIPALENATTGAVESVAGRLVSKADLTVDGAPARDLVIEAGEGDVTLRTRMVILGSTFFQIMAVGPREGPPAGSERFINSFRLTPPASMVQPATKPPTQADTSPPAN